MSIRITLIYDATAPGEERVAKDICGELNECSVNVRGVSSPGDMTAFMSETTPENCQVLININLTGYGNETTGGLAAINRMPMNIVNVITRPVAECEAVLKKTQSYMAHFVFTDEDEAIKAENEYPHLWHITSCKDAEEIADYVGEMELRYSK